MDRDDLVVGAVYRVRARNFGVAVWDGEQMLGPREKFGHRYLDRETVGWTIHPDTIERLGEEVFDLGDQAVVSALLWTLAEAHRRQWHLEDTLMTRWHLDVRWEDGDPIIESTTDQMARSDWYLQEVRSARALAEAEGRPLGRDDYKAISQRCREEWGES